MSAIPYRPSIDGLRAFAILSVFIFHLNKTWLPGGFVGVDVFFVISGFLITSIIYQECKEGRFQLSRFYQRRIARIFPAFFVVALVTLAAASQIYSPQDFASAGANLAAAALSVSNLKSMLQGNYFEVSEDALPYLHYWSLAVEEQYYLLFPFFFLGIYKYFRPRVTATLVALTLSSLAFGIILTKINPTWAFFLLPARAWELMGGALLAVVLLDGRLTQNKLTHLWPIAGFVLVILSFLVVPEGPSFPGTWALLPVIGTLGILANTNLDHPIEKLLSWRPLVAIGKISYSLYLWHWPIFALVDYQMLLAPEWLRLILKLTLTIGATLLSYFWIETPARGFLTQQKYRRFAYATTTAVIIFCCVLGSQIRKSNYINATTADVAQSGLVFGDKNSKNTVILVGDSNGSMYGVLLKKLVADKGGRFVCLSVAAADPLPKRGEPMPPLWKNVLAVVGQERPSTVVLVCHWEDKLKNGYDRLDMAISDLSPLTDQVLLFTQPPILPPTATRRNIRSKQSIEPFFEDPDVKTKRASANAYVLSRISSKVTVLDAAKFFEGANGEIVFKSNDGKPNYHDFTHLSGYGSAVIEKAVADILCHTN
jgi:peptidoglycan/LPS O-acetylase OafA/YrhL